MDDGERLSIDLDYWDENVGAFEPSKVLNRLRLAFSDVEIDPTDHQRVRLLRELESWSQCEKTPELRETLIRQSWGLYQTSGPMYRFLVQFPSGHRVPGYARRMSVSFTVASDLAPEFRDQLTIFLGSLRMGQLTIASDREEE